MMINPRSVSVVFVITGYTDGTIDVIMDVPDKGKFDTVKQCFVNLLKWVKHSIAESDKCPYSPKNPNEVRYENINDKPFMK